MKHCYIILFGVYILFFIGCKPDPDLDPNPCNPPVTKVYPDLYEFLPDSFYPILKYKNSNNAYFKFDLTVSELDTTPATNKPCINPSWETFYLVYHSNYNAVSKIEYILFPEPNRIITFYIGPYNSCESLFFFQVDSMYKYTHIDTLHLNNKTFYDVYYLMEFPTPCCSGIYYNKQYGIVGFNWNYEWYALETDSL